ncbi:MAG: LPP20 family lipoprotein [Gammaproteobacteria bacterium]|nr:LPP20 family lipoprotein [Gammaproteobacteria bacterium]MDH5651143.1 LPP20 family lipoprotein [Gammaproteobacteria bacterium]
MKYLITSLCIATLVLQGCASTKKGGGMPDWVNGNSAQYPTTAFLIGRGEHSSQAMARDRARADLAKIFEVAIQEQSTDIVKYSSQKIGKDTIEQLESEASRDISTRTEQVVKGVEINDIWQDPKTKVFHALATINRMQASSRLREQINQLDGQTGSYLSKARSSNDLITKIGLATRAVSTQIERDSSQRILKIIDRSGVGVPPSYNLGQLISDRDNLVKRLRISARASRDDLGDAERIVAGALARVGFSHSQNEQALYVLDVQAEMQPVEDRAGWFWVRGMLDINLMDSKTNESHGSHRWEIKASGQTVASAKKRAQNQIDEFLKNELKQTIISFGMPE